MKAPQLLKMGGFDQVCHCNDAIRNQYDNGISMISADSKTIVYYSREKSIDESQQETKYLLCVLCIEDTAPPQTYNWKAKRSELDSTDRFILPQIVGEKETSRDRGDHRSST